MFWPACQPKDLQTLLEPGHALGSVLAEESLRLAGAKKQVALITHDASWGPASTTEEAFKETLKKHGITVVTAKAANLGNPMLSGQVGLKVTDFIEALEKSAGAGAVVSLVGVPRFAEADLARLPRDHPPVLVVATATLGNKMGVRSAPEQLAQLLEAKVIQLAIVDGVDPGSPASPKRDSVHDLFAQHYRCLRRPD